MSLGISTNLEVVMARYVMSNEHRKRTKHFNLFLLDEEMEILNDKAAAANMSKTEYIRNVVLFGAARRRTNFASADADKISHELNRIGNNINQIAYQANSKCAVDENDFFWLREEFTHFLAAFERFVIG